MLATEKAAAIALFADVPREKLGRLAALGELSEVQAGHQLFRVGDRAADLYVLDEGQVDLTVVMEISGERREVTVETVKPGSTLAWSSMVEPHVLTLSARAVQDSRLIRFPGKDLEQIIQEEPDVGVKVLRSLCELVGHRLQRFQALWLMEIQRSVMGEREGS